MNDAAAERSAEVRDALAVVQTSVYLIRKQLSDDERETVYLEKHLSRIEASVERATRALADQ
jgi:cob(I)alamin adenosyltransferase